MRLLICDDDLFFAEKIKQSVEVFFAKKDIRAEISVCTSAEQVLEIPDLEGCQLAFLDVKLSAMNGIELGQQIGRKNPEILLVYISGYLEFAPQGYTVRAYRYLLKNDIARMLSDCLEDACREMSLKHKFLLIQVNREILRIDYDSIYYLQSSGRKVVIYGTALSRPICAYYRKLSELPSDMFERDFLKVAHSTVVNMRYVEKIWAYKVRLANGAELGISRGMYQEVYGRYLEWKGLYGEN